MSMEAAREGQSSRGNASLVNRFDYEFHRPQPLNQEQRIRAAYEFVEHQINSVIAYKIIEGKEILDTVTTYEARTSKMHSSRLLHTLPGGTSVRINRDTARASLYVGRKKYNPSN